MEFVDQGGVSGRTAALAARIKDMLAEIPDRVAPDDFKMREAVDGTRLVLTDNRHWVFEANAGFLKIEISRNAVEILYTFSFSHAGIYESMFAGRGNLSGDFDTDDDPELAAHDIGLKWVYDESTGTSVRDMPDVVPEANPGAEAESIEEKAFNIAYYAIHFHLLHELAHLYVFKGRELTDEERFAEEIDCDRLAVRWMRIMRPRDERDARRIRAGISYGLAYVAAQSIDRRSHDGITHPKSYDRLVNVLGEFFDPADDAWAYPFAILVGHMTEQNMLPLPDGVWPEDGAGEFIEGVHRLRDVIRQSDTA